MPVPVKFTLSALLFLVAFMIDMPNNALARLALPNSALICILLSLLGALVICKMHIAVIGITLFMCFMMNLPETEAHAHMMINQDMWLAALIVLMCMPNVRKWLEI